MSYIKIFEPGTPERNQLELAATLLNKYSPCNISYAIKDIYFDFGQRWMWTTLVVNTKGPYSYQICPSEQAKIIESDTVDKLAEVVNYFIAREIERYKER